MRVGYGTAVLTVADGTPLGGYSERDGLSAGAVDPLHADCVSIAGNATRMVLVVVDLVCVNTDLARLVRTAVREAVDEPGMTTDVWVCATHTHSAPDVDCRPGGGTTPPEVAATVAGAALDAARQAVAGETACTADYLCGDVEGVASVRGEADGGTTVPVDVVRFRAAGGDGYLVTLPVHPTVLGPENLRVSADLAGSVRAALTDRLSTGRVDPWVVVTTGAAGDISTRRTRDGRTPAECSRLGALAADQIVTLLAGAWTSVWGPSGGEVVTVRRTVEPPAREDATTGLTEQEDRIRAELRRAQLRGDRLAERTAHTAAQGLQLAREWTADPAGTPPRAVLSAAAIGGMLLFGVGGEPFLSMRARMSGRADTPCLVLGYANGYCGYIPNSAAFRVPGYEALASPFAAHAEDVIVAELVSLAGECGWDCPGATA